MTILNGCKCYAEVLQGICSDTAKCMQDNCKGYAVEDCRRDIVSSSQL